MASGRTLAPGARRGLALAAAVALCAAGRAGADGLAFDGDLPAAEHLLLDLTARQREAIAQAGRRGGPWPEVTLTGAQRKALGRAFGVAPRWVVAVPREALAGACTCGAFNLGVLAGGRLAVLRTGLGDHLGARDVDAMDRAITDRRLLVPGPTPLILFDEAPAAEGGVAALAARLPAIAADGTVRLPRGWTAQRLRVAGVPRLDEAERKDPAPALHALAAIAGRPSAAGVLRWPELGARREADGAVLWLLPGLARGEPGPPRRAWFLLEYRGGRLAAAVAAAADGARTSVAYAWEEAGEPGRAAPVLPP